METVLVKPIRGRVLVDPIYPRHKGLIFTGHLRPEDIPTTGRVISMPARRLTKKGIPVDWEFKVGDIVVMKRYSCQQITLRKRELIAARASEVLAVIEDENAIEA
jgi:chaperonin GroES